MIADAFDVWALRSSIARLVDSRDRLRGLEAPVKAILVDALVDAVGHAMCDLSLILTGKQAKPSAWRKDIFVIDVCDALRAAGVPFTMDPDPANSVAQFLALAVADIAGLPIRGSLYHQMQYQQPHHQRRIKKTPST